MRTQDEEPPYTVLARMPGTVSIKGVAPMVSETLSGHGKPDGCLTVLGDKATRRVSRGANRVQPTNSKGGNWWQSPFCGVFRHSSPSRLPQNGETPRQQQQGCRAPISPHRS